MKEDVHIISTSRTPEAIDFNKLKLVFRKNILWLALIFIAANAASYLYIRYTKNVYESVSEIKLDTKQEASEFGFRDFTNTQDLKMVSGEIENIQSKSFLNSIIDSLDIQVSYYSIGQVLNNELYTSTPFIVKHDGYSSKYFNAPFKVAPINNRQFRLVPANGSELEATYGEEIHLDELTLTITRSNKAEFESGNNYSFVINTRGVLLDYLMSSLTVEPLNLNANTIKVSFTDYNPVKAHDLVNRIDSLYLLYSYDQKNQANRQKIEWLSSELEQIESKMEGFEDYFEDFTLKNKTYDLESDLRKTVEAMHVIDSQRYEITVRINDANKIQQSLSETGTINFGMLHPNRLPSSINTGITKLQEMYSEMDNMKLSYNETTYAYRQKENEITISKNTIKKQLEELKKNLLSELQRLGSTKSRLEMEFATMPDKNTQFSKNQRFYKLYEEFYLTLMQNKSEFEIAQAGSTPEFKILSAATLPTEPIAPNKPVIYGIGLVAGLTFCVMFLGLLYVLNNKVTGLGELEQVAGVPALGIIPVLRNRQGHELHIIDQPKSMVSEAFRSLRTNLDFFSANANKKVIAISSTVSGEGKSFVAENLGAALAQSNKKVVLLDLDMRKTHRVNISKQPKDQSSGVSTILINKSAWQDCIINTTQDRFDFIPAGTQPPNPAELLLNGSFESLLNQLRDQYDFIILDTPPVGLVADGITAMKKADLSIYIFRANYSRRDFLHNLRRIVNLNKLPNVTSILNGMPVPYNSDGYGYYEDRSTKGFLNSLLKKRA